MSATDELKPCPFCGGENLASNWHSPFIVCNDCGAFGPGNADSTHEQAVEAWNTRTPEQAIAATLESGKLTAEQVEAAIQKTSSYTNFDGCTFYTRGLSLQALADELNATLDSGECELIEVDSYSNANEVIHVLECSACGETCEHVNGSYPKCPHCGKAVKR